MKYNIKIKVEVFRWDPDEGATDIIDFWNEDSHIKFESIESVVMFIYTNFNTDNMIFEDNIIKIEKVQQEGPEYELKVYNITILKTENITEEIIKWLK